jgi:hypothetical protein
MVSHKIYWEPGLEPDLEPQRGDGAGRNNFGSATLLLAVMCGLTVLKGPRGLETRFLFLCMTLIPH